MTINDVTVSEGEALSFTISLSAAASEPIVLSFTTVDGTAKDGVGEAGAGIPDYVAQTGTLTILAGETSATITISTVDDGVFEPTEGFTIELTPLSGAIDAPTSDLVGVGTILDDGDGGEAGAPVGGAAFVAVREAGIEAVPGHFDAGSAAASDDERAEGGLGLSFGPDGPAASGAFTWLNTVGADDPETAPPADIVLESGGWPINWQVSADGLTLNGVIEGGPHDGEVVATLVAQSSGTGADTQVSFVFEQRGPIDHPDVGEREAADPIRLDFVYRITDSTGDSTTGNLTVDVLDDGPDGNVIAKADTVLSGDDQFNLAFVIDISNSMSNAIESGETRLEAAVAALESVLRQAQSAGVVGPVLIAAFHGQLVPFSFQPLVKPVVITTSFASVEAALGEVSPGVSGIEAFFGGIFSGQSPPVPDFSGNFGSTRYEGGLDAAADWLTGTLTGPGIAPPNPIETSDNRLFFLTDGGNNNGVGGFDPQAQDVEKLYDGSIPNLTIKTVGIEAAAGFVDDLDRTDDLDDTNDSIVIINDLQSAQQISAGFGNVVGGPGATISSGNLLIDDDALGAEGADGVLPQGGADGLAGLVSLSFRDASGAEVTVNASGTYTTDLGGRITVDFETGDYLYVAPSADIAGLDRFTYVVRDGDGDPVGGTLDMVIERQPAGALQPLALADLFEGNSVDGAIALQGDSVPDSDGNGDAFTGQITPIALLPVPDPLNIV